MNINRNALAKAGDYWTLKAKLDKLAAPCKARAILVRKIRAIESAIYGQAATV